ncbi:hypothetical protein Tco_0165603, partial [Tanacetum coccineum]
VMSSASSAVTYTFVYTNYVPGRAFWGVDDEEISDGGIPRVIVYEYDGLPMQYDTEFDPKEDPEGYEDDETEDCPVDYPMDGGNDEDEDEEDMKEEEEEHPAPADSAIVVPTVEPISPPEGTELVIPPPST